MDKRNKKLHSISGDMSFIKTVITFILVLVISSNQIKRDFLFEQTRYSRVKEAFESKSPKILKQLKEKNLNKNNFSILMVVYKEEKVLEIYARNKSDQVYQLLNSYKICAKSGEAGPKVFQGDGQVPEGIYHINRFNPLSSYYLSLGLNYPNKVDLKRSRNQNPGADIFIHGSCVSIGCLAMTDELIKEIYLLAVLSRNNGQKQIPVYIFPFQMRQEKINVYAEMNKNKPELLLFWSNLKKAYDSFHKNKKEVPFSISKNGTYEFHQ